MTTITLRIEEDLKKDFKRVCLENDVTQSEIIIKWIENYIKENTNEKNK
ncbi:MAG: hypothetical protein SOV59_08330 [Fusobacterium mortiferum]|nr:hypothetical protein [Fusobacterium mortiferum]